VGVIALLVGAVLAAFGGDRFVRGCVGISEALRVPPGIIGATVAAFATSSPELVVAVLAAADGESALALGNAAGSNVVNLGLVLGVTLVAVPVAVRRGDLRRELPALLFLTGLVGLLAADGTLSRVDATVVLVSFAAWATWVAYDARRARDLIEEVVGEHDPRRALFDVVLGAVLLVGAGRLLMSGAQWVGDTLGWDEFVTGAVLVAVATSMPELATTLISLRRGHVEVGLGALLGSNVFNLGFVAGVAGVISPAEVTRGELSVALGFGLLVAVLVVPGVRGVLGRSRGALLLASYAAYTAGLFLVT
jgi:cation:H+ antiporter